MATQDRAFRPDINGLRAVAVVSVLLFHFGLPGFHGGFVGVDVFFVISGYLMTQLIVSGLDADRFSLSQFYLARTRRIVPALAVVCAFVLAAGYMRLTPPDYEAIGRHVASSLLFVSNLDYMRRTSYFDDLGNTNWLLHTWSLSIEFQFYLIYPCVLWALHKWCKRPGRLDLWVTALFGFSYFLSALPTRIQPFDAFFVLPTRAWEMLGGGLIWLSPPGLREFQERHRRRLIWVGTIMIAGSVVLMSGTLKWPGRLAMLPVMGTMFLLLARAEKSWLATSRISQHLGNTSYSIYLWHWPLLGLFNQLPLSAAARIGLGLPASLVCGWLSYRWVEAPGRRFWTGRATLPGSLAFTAAILAVALAGSHVAAHAGLPERSAMRDYAHLKHDVLYVNINDGWCFVDDRTVDIHYRPAYSSCDLGDKSAPKRALLWGDSHAGHFTPLVDALAKAAHVRLRVLGTPECWPLLRGGTLGINPEVCAHFRDDVLQTAKNYDVIILAARWDATGIPQWDEELRYTLDTLAATHKQIIVLRQVPLFDSNVAERYIYDSLFGYPTQAKRARVLSSDLQNEQVREMVKATPNAVFVDASSMLCAGGGSQCATKIGNTMMYSDNQHLSVPGSQWIAQRLLANGQNFLR